MNRPARPSLLVSTVVVVLLTAGWGFVRLFLFPEAVLPLTFVIPLMVCIWTGRPWQLGAMAAAFAAMAIAKIAWILPGGALGPGETTTYAATLLFNIGVGAGVVHLVLSQRNRLEKDNETILAQNAELEAQAEELLQQNEEIRAQAEELAEQNEEIEAQSEEVTRQNEDLGELNTRLAGRGEILQGLLESSRNDQPLSHALESLCRRAKAVIGAPAAALVYLERCGDQLFVQAQSSDGGAAIPPVWPLAGSIAQVACDENRTAYISNLARRADLAQPFGEASAFGSVLATPVAAGERGGLLVACSREPGHWTEEQFRVIEWIAAQCALMVETLRSRNALAEHADALAAANRSKDRFLAMLSHELRTPLTPMLATAGALERDGRLPGDVREDLRMIRRNAAIQSRLVDDLLDLTRISRGKIEIDRQTLPAAALLRHAAEIVSGELDARNQRLELDFDGAGECALNGDGPRLQQVFWNLLKNAIKFSPEGAAIQMRARACEERLIVEVRDRGVGIALENLERIFLPFEQILEEPRRAGGGGLGLGLAIAKTIVELHGGVLSAHSDGEGLGATFTVELPATAFPAEAAGQGGASPSPLPPRKASRILLIEDHVDTGMILARLLRSSGYTVEHAKNATEGWRLFEQSEVDLIISDLGLPDGNGLDLMRRFREARPATPGICLSGFGMEEDVRACRQAGFREHLTKPVDLQRLEAAITRALA